MIECFFSQLEINSLVKGLERMNEGHSLQDSKSV